MTDFRREQSLLTARDMTVEFPGVRALDCVDFELLSGECHALVGENGAGKSTLARCLIGEAHPTSGTIEVGGTVVPSHFDVRKSQELGVAIVHQEFQLVDEMSGLENIYLGHMPSVGPFVSQAMQRANAQKLMEELGISIDLTIPVKRLRTAEKQIIQLLRALVLDAKILILDELTAVLPEDDVLKIFEIVEILKSKGKGIIYISHRLDEIFAICDRYTVLMDGRHIETGNVKELTKSRLVELIAGRVLEEIFPIKRTPNDEILLEVRNASGEGFESIDLTVHAGEVVAIAGLVGAGKSELLRAIFGELALKRGEIFVKGKRIESLSPRRAISQGIAFVPDERKALGFVNTLSLRRNATLAAVKKFRKIGDFVDQRAEQNAVHSVFQRLNLRYSSQSQSPTTLSGGNQQKVVLSKWILADSDIYLMDEPTRGIDVGAKSEIYRLIVDLTSRGKGVLLVSPEIEEIVGLANRVYVMYEGRIVGEFAGEEIEQSDILRALLGAGE